MLAPAGALMGLMNLATEALGDIDPMTIQRVDGPETFLG